MHTAPDQAARVADEANVDRLVLVHLPHGFDEHGPAMVRARVRFPRIDVGFDGARYELVPTVARGWRAVGASASHSRA
jgi:ribonuclease BN (tRNA processing enzyme)